MKKQIVVPMLTPEMTEGVLVSWEKNIGDTIKKGEILFEIETDKVISQVEADFDGTLLSQLADEGDRVAVGTVIGEIEDK